MMYILRQAQDERVSELYTFVVSLRAFVVSLRALVVSLRTLRVSELGDVQSELEDAPVVSLSNRCRSARTGRPHPTVIRPVVI